MTAFAEREIHYRINLCNKICLIPYKRLESSFCVGFQPPGHGTCPKLWLIHPVRLHWRKLVTVLLSTADSFKVGVGWEPESTFSTECWDPVWLELVQGLSMLPLSLWVLMHIRSLVSGRLCFLGINQCQRNLSDFLCSSTLTSLETLQASC